MKIAAIFLMLTLPLAAFTPELKWVEPQGGQVGTEVEARFVGERLDGINGALFYEPGITLTDIKVKDGTVVTGKLKIAPDAVLGEHSLRLTAPDGITDLRTFWVGAFPTVKEVEPNGMNDPAQRVALNSTIHGVAVNEDDDCFVVSLKKGQRLSAEVEAMRLGHVMFDTSLSVIGPDGFELATCDDAALLRTDAFISLLVPEDGDYRVVVREAAYEGNDSCRYRLHIGTFPRPKGVFPTGGKPGETIEFTFIGDPSGPIRQTITLPSEVRADFAVFPQDGGMSAPSPHLITVSPFEWVRDGDGSETPKGAVPIPAVPCAALGVIDDGKPSDWFKFTAKKDEALTLKVIARGHRSPLDSMLSIHDAKQKHLVSNDDQGGPDSVIQWVCPADGDYLIQIRDQLRRSGADFTYRIEVTGKSPSIGATLPVVERVKSQKWKTFPVPRGNRYAAVVNVTRENTNCDSVFGADSLPPGVTMRAGRIPKGVTSFPVVFEAAGDAPVGAGLYDFWLRSEGVEPALTGRLVDTIHHIDINNQGAYHSASFDRIATAVTVEAPFKVDLLAPAGPIVKNGKLMLKVRAVRQSGFAEKITLKFLWSPPGITGPVSVDIPKDKLEAEYELNASGDAAVGDWPVCVLAEANTPKGPVLVSTALVTLKVAEPYVGLTLDLAAAEVGKPAAMLAKIEGLRPFSGQAEAILSGLPHGVSCAPQKFAVDQEEITFSLKIAEDAKVGKHGGLFCMVSVPENGVAVLHQTAMGGTLRIDAPVKGSGKPVPKAVEAPAGKKPLSRLEQLRQQKK